ncbi:MAG: hypothetical protein IKS20_00810 [Victivallales bacterium]|nr:hypothetical protein [Victivallales bacterium]
MKRIIVTSVLLCCAMLMADFKLDNVFSSNMVLQRGVPVSFFGTGTPGTKVKAEFKGKTVEASVDAEGNWRAEFPAAEADHVEYTATFKDDKKTVELKSLLLGDVWFCSGQSNMALLIGATFRRGSTAQNCEEEVKNATHPELRYAGQQRRSSHLKGLPAALDFGGWVKSSPQHAARFSAVAYFFGRQLNQDLNIPIGVINSSWGGTSIQQWISKEGFYKSGVEPEASSVRRLDKTEEELDKFDAEENERYITNAKKWYDALYAAKPELAFDETKLNVAEMKTDDWADKMAYKPGIFYVRWYSQSFKLNAAMKNSCCVFIQNPSVRCDVWLDGKHVAKSRPGTGKWLKRPMYIAIPKDADKEGTFTLTVRAEYVDRQFQGCESDLLQKTVLRNKANQTQQLKAWKIKEETALVLKKDMKLPRFPAFPECSHRLPHWLTHLYYGQVDAWTKLPIKGVIWYQGCSNNGSMHYYPMHKALIQDWRDKWKQPDLPFIITQLAGYGARYTKDWNQYDPTIVQPYAVTRDIQMQMLTLPNVGLACTIDIGENTNIHPANKQDVGKRLALEAERVAYKMNVVSQGPVFDKAVPEGNALRIFFKNAKGLKTSDGKAPAGFAIAGEDKKFVWADAKIEGENIVASSPKVAAPKYVRYAFINFHKDLNLQNGSNLPAYPFRSDAVDYSQVK